ncbi:hypothetical protein FPZ12_000030 [Amycolatopsis acidicola]|uniref:Uncharacterized protein n=1 Tax=Amycolatopsis acidicola TaxID=2596893 RepID=A0A5N0VM89_9PSEU|nr:hypothetical protein [Amycolatopsis acidicola]KAA9166653.1 hypothetical protein FPZ12_000030 [Amycolatopsis acidicola]
MGKTTVRIGALGFLLMASAAVTLPGVASADTAAPVVDGNCTATFQDDSGKPLTVDAGALLNSPKALTVGTGTQADGLVKIPAADAVKTLGIGGIPLVGDLTAKVVCPAAQDTANTLGATTQSLLSGEPKDVPHPSAPAPAPTQPAPPSTPPATTPQQPTTNENLTGGGFQFANYPLTMTSPWAGLDLAALAGQNPISALAPGMVPPTGTAPAPLAQDSGTAQAMPADSAGPAKLPLLLAAVALALVVAGLAHTWLRRKIT